MRPDAVTHRRVLAIALPIVLSNATIPILGAVDTAVVGQLGAAAPIGAVGLGAVILTSLYWVFGFLRMGTTGLAAQARGAGDGPEAGAVLLRGLAIAALAGFFCVAVQGLLAAAAFRLAPASAEVEALARSYLAIRIWGAPATIALYAITGWLIAMERTRGVLVLQLAMNGLNAGLDVWFVLGLGWGVPGVAFATLIAEAAGLGIGLWLCRGAFAGGAWRDAARILDAARLRVMALVNRDILLRSVILQAAFTTFLFLGAGFGDVTLAANQILLQFLYITAYALDGFAFSAEALVGQAAGARRPDSLRRSALRAGSWALAAAAALAFGIALGGSALVALMTPSEAVRAEALRYLPWLAASPLVAVAAYLLDGVFIGAMATRALRRAMVQAGLVYLLALAAFVPAFGNHGLWAALMTLFVARAVTLGLAYPRLEAGVGPGVASS